MMRLRQLPQLYLRGAIANETMRYLGDDDRDNINRLTKEISKLPIMAGHKYRFIEKLGQTIGGDYYRNPEAAEQEFEIAIWRALVYLLHHSDYSFQCQACQSHEYTTSKNKPKVFDRRFPICPACNKVKIVDPGSVLPDAKPGDFVDFDLMQDAITAASRVAENVVKDPVHTTPVVSIKGAKKIHNHAEVLNDPDQIVKYFGEFAWNYFRQTLRENKIRTHQLDGTWVGDKFVRGQTVAGPADKVAVEEINSLLTQLEVPHRYEPRGNPIDGAFRIQVELLITGQQVSRQVRTLIEKYAALGVKVWANDTEVCVGVAADAPQVEATIITPQQVCVHGSSTGSGEEDASVYDVHQHRIRNGAIGGYTTMQEDGIAEVETNDLIETIRGALSDGAQKVYDILTQQGQTYDEFVEFQIGTQKHKHMDRVVASTHIAKFLNTSPKQVNAWVKDIKVQCLAHDLGS